MSSVAGPARKSQPSGRPGAPGDAPPASNPGLALALPSVGGTPLVPRPGSATARSNSGSQLPLTRRSPRPLARLDSGAAAVRRVSGGLIRLTLGAPPRTSVGRPRRPNLEKPVAVPRKCRNCRTRPNVVASVDRGNDCRQTARNRGQLVAPRPYLSASVAADDEATNRRGPERRPRSLRGNGPRSMQFDGRSGQGRPPNERCGPHHPSGRRPLVKPAPHCSSPARSAATRKQPDSAFRNPARGGTAQED